MAMKSWMAALSVCMLATVSQGAAWAFGDGKPGMMGMKKGGKDSGEGGPNPAVANAFFATRATEDAMDKRGLIKT